MAGHGIIKRLPSSSRGPKVSQAATEWVCQEMRRWEDSNARHGVQALCHDDPINMTIVVGIRCKNCESMVRSSVAFSSEDLDKAVVDKFRDILIGFQARFSPSCEEARRMNIVRRVMES